MELAHGVVTYRMLRATEGNIEVDTPSLSVRPSRPGSYRVSVNDGGETEVTARNGDVEVFTPRGSQWVHNGQSLMARGAAGDAEFQVVVAGPIDDWDRWSDSRDRAMLQSTSSRYVGPGVYGAEDMDPYGSWTSVPEYGNVWHPNVGPDWAPYQAGRWVWEDWYGWTWVSADPWGWAPYHYGRWFRHDRFGWCWYPGLITARHFWSPALVGFVGFGSGVGFGLGFGNVGWVPLAPFEVFHPWWGRGFGGGFNRSVNITNVNITNVYRNSRFRNGISAVAAHDFQSGRFNNVIRTSGSQVGSAGVIRGQMPFTAGSQNMRFSDRQATSIPRGNNNARFFTHQQPNPVQRSQFRGASSVQQATPQVNRGGTVGAEQRCRLAALWFAIGPVFGFAGKSAGGKSQRCERAWARHSVVIAHRPPSKVDGSDSAIRRAAARPVKLRLRLRRARNLVPARVIKCSVSLHRSGGRQESLRIAPPVVRERPSYNAPRPSAPGYSGPRQSAPSYSAPRQQSSPAPRNNGGGSPRGNGGGNAPRGNSGGGHGNRSR